jgi:hypothetical protein
VADLRGDHLGFDKTRAAAIACPRRTVRRAWVLRAKRVADNPHHRTREVDPQTEQGIDARSEIRTARHGILGFNTVDKVYATKRAQLGALA